MEPKHIPRHMQLIEQLRHIGFHDHLCLVPGDPSEQMEVFTAYLAWAGDRREHCLPLLVESSRTVLDRRLARLGYPVIAEAGGDTTVRPALQAARAGRLLEYCRDLAGRVASKGGVGLRVLCDMAWLSRQGMRIGQIEDFVRLLACCGEGEPVLFLNSFCPSMGAARLVCEAIGCHPFVIQSGVVCRNFYYSMQRPPVASRPVGVEDPVTAGEASQFRRGQVLDAIFRTAPIGLWMLNREHRMVFTNRNFCAATGISEEEFLSADHYSEVMAPETALKCMLSDTYAFGAEGHIAAEERLLGADGRFRDYQIVKTKVLDPAGEFDGLLGLAIDITDRKRAERLLSESESRFRDIALSIADIIWETGPDWRLTYISEQVTSVLGFQPEEMLGQPLYEFFVAEEAGRLLALCRQLTDGKRPFRNAEHWALHKAGQPCCLLLNGLPRQDEQGVFAGYRGVAQNITHRKVGAAGLKRALADSQDARDNIDSILRSIGDGLIAIDERGCITMMNPKAAAIFSVAADEWVGQPLDRLCVSQEIREKLRGLVNGIESGVEKVELVWPGRETATPRHYQARISTMRNPRGEATGAILIFQDVTREREMDRVKKEFISNAAHELRTPLTSIMGYLEFCLHPEDFGGFSEEQRHEFLAEIYDKAEVLERIVSDLLDIARIDSGRPIPLEMGRVDLREVCTKVVEHFQLQFPRHRFELEFAAQGRHELHADRAKLEQVLENLLSNAVKYSEEDSLICISGRAESGIYRLSVRDQGIGMTPEQRQRMFETFYRAPGACNGVRGLGLGMNIVKHIIERHGGAIEVFSETGQGTEILLRLPFTN